MNIRVTSLLHLLTAITGTILLQGCFTGIESTPKITAGDVRREKVVVTEEQRFLSDIDRQPLDQWEEGKLFYVTDDKVTLLFGAEGLSLPRLAGSYLTFVSVTDIPAVTGGHVAAFTFRTPDGRTVTYRSDRSTDAWRNARFVDIPFTIEQSIVDRVKEYTEGRRLYVVTPQWYDTSDRARRGRKFIEVTVDTVAPGNTDYPIRLSLNDGHGDRFRLFMSVGSGLSAPRDFSSLFSFHNPREKYPLINDKVWNNIINGTVIEDMTRDECRLALGAPAEIDRRPGYSYLREIWTYENGIFLIFEDGLLRNFRR